MPRKKKNDGSVDPTLPEIPSELLDQFVTGPMTAESVEAVMRKFKKTIIERALGAEMSHHLGYVHGVRIPRKVATRSTAKRPPSPRQTRPLIPCHGGRSERSDAGV